jgi:hypothetical protein
MTNALPEAASPTMLQTTIERQHESPLSEYAPPRFTQPFPQNPSSIPAQLKAYSRSATKIAWNGSSICEDDDNDN